MKSPGHPMAYWLSLDVTSGAPIGTRNFKTVENPWHEQKSARGKRMDYILILTPISHQKVPCL
jgi:hypothetical protein